MFRRNKSHPEIPQKVPQTLDDLFEVISSTPDSEDDGLDYFDNIVGPSTLQIGTTRQQRIEQVRRSRMPEEIEQRKADARAVLEAFGIDQ